MYYPPIVEAEERRAHYQERLQKAEIGWLLKQTWVDEEDFFPKLRLAVSLSSATFVAIIIAITLVI